jgi:hypothetical protein
LDSIEQIVSDPAYLSGCEILPTGVPREQVSLRGVIPGVSSDTDVKNMLGEPNRRSYGGHQWLYDGVSILFDDQTDVVEEIWIVGGTTFDQMALPVRDIIGRYGCPELIYAYDGGEEKRGHFDLTTLAYPELGIEFDFLGTPISLESRPREVYISAAAPVHDYLLDWKWLFESPDTSVVLPWDEAVGR